MKKVIFIDYLDKRLFLRDSMDLSFTADINYAKEFSGSVDKMLKKLLYSGYDCDTISYHSIYEIFNTERSANGLLSSDGRCRTRSIA